MKPVVKVPRLGTTEAQSTSHVGLRTLKTEILRVGHRIDASHHTTFLGSESRGSLKRQGIVGSHAKIAYRYPSDDLDTPQVFSALKHFSAKQRMNTISEVERV